jgi:hypothetical protein
VAIDVTNNWIYTIYIICSFCPSFLLLFIFLQLDLLAAISTPWVAMILAYTSSRRRLARGEALSSSVDRALDCHRKSTKPDSPVCQIRGSDFLVLSRSFRLPIRFMSQHSLATPLGNWLLQAWWKTKGGYDVNASDLNKDNIIKPTFDTLTEEDRKALKAYHAKIDELFFLHYEVTLQGSSSRMQCRSPSQGRGNTRGTT